MADERNPLLSRRLIASCAKLNESSEPTGEIWQAAVRDYATTELKDQELERVLAERDLAGFKQILDEWNSDRRPLPIEDRTLLKRAMKAFRKRLKVTRLDDESRLGVGATTRGEQSCIVGITPPVEFPPAVWVELARQKRLKDGGRGMYELND